MSKHSVAAPEFAEALATIEMASSSDVRIEADFTADWARYLEAQLATLDCKVNRPSDVFDLAIAFFNALARRISSVPREVMISPEFECPPEHLEAVYGIATKILAGDDLTANLSTAIHEHSAIDDNLFNDGLLNDWGIHHLHLGMASHFRLPHFVARTEHVLFVRVSDDVAYFITVMPHRQWANLELLGIIHRTWPNSIERFRLPGVSKVDPVYNPGELIKLRRAGITTFVEMEDGTVYMPPGRGITSSRVGAAVADRANYYTHSVRWIEDWVRKNFAHLVDHAASTGVQLGPVLRLRFVAFVPGAAVIIDDASNVKFELPMN